MNAAGFFSLAIRADSKAVAFYPKDSTSSRMPLRASASSKPTIIGCTVVKSGKSNLDEFPVLPKGDHCGLR